MKKLINDPNSFVDECLEGILLAKKGQLRAVGEDLRSIVDANCPRPGHVVWSPAAVQGTYRFS